MRLKKVMVLLLSLAICIQCLPFNAYADADSTTVQISDKIKGKTLRYLGLNPGIYSYYPDGSVFGNPDEFGTYGFWVKQLGANAIRSWGWPIQDERVINGVFNSNDTIPDGDGVNSEAAYNSAIKAVLKNPEKNKYINWDMFDRAKLITPIEAKSKLGIESLAVIRIKYSGPTGMASFMGATPENNFSRSLSTWKDKWEWWEYSYAMAYLYATLCNTTSFEIGNEPGWQQQGGSYADEHALAVDIAANAIHAAVKSALGEDKANIFAFTEEGARIDRNEPDGFKFNYTEEILKSSGDKINGFTYHVYGDKTAATKKYLDTIPVDKKIYLSECGADSNTTDTSKLMYNVTDLFNLLSMPNDRLEGVLYFKASGGGGNEMIGKNANGVFFPRPGFWGYRMLFRAGVNQKDVYESVSSDRDISALVTKDADNTFITLKNSSTTEKTYTLNVPSWVEGDLQHVFLYDMKTYLDASWENGISVNGSTITVSVQPGQSLVQIILGKKPLNTVPVQYDESKFTIKGLTDAYITPDSLPATQDIVKPMFLSTFDLTFKTKPASNNRLGSINSVELADSEDWYSRSYSNLGIANNVRGVIYSGRLNILNNETVQNNDGITRVLWQRNMVRMSKLIPVILETDMGYEEQNIEGYMGVIYRDNNGNMIAVRAVTDESGKFELVKFTNPKTPEFLFTDAAEKLWTSSIPVKKDQKIRLTLESEQIRVQILDIKGKKLDDSGDISHNAEFSGIGRIGLGKFNASPVWYDNLQIMGTPGFATAPEAPVIKDASSLDSRVKLQWDLVPNAVGYTIKYGTASENLTNKVFPGNVNTFTLGGLTNNTPYYFSVIAYNENGESTQSNILLSTPVAEMNLTSPPAITCTYPLNNNTVLAVWEPVNNASSYTVKYGTASGTYNKTISVAGDSNQAGISGLVSGTTYYFVVIAKNSAGESVASAEKTAVPYLPIIPTTPGRNYIKRVDGKTLGVAWTPSLSRYGIQKYVIIYQMGDILMEVPADVTNVNIAFSKRYDIDNERIFVYAVDNRGMWSTSAYTGSFLIGPYWLPGSEVKASDLRDTGVTLTWTPPITAISDAKYRILQDGVAIKDSQGNDVLVSDATYTINNLVPNTTYTFMIVSEETNWNIPTASDGPQITVTTTNSPVN